MKKHLLTIGAVALATFATQQAVQATLVETGTGNLTGAGPSSITVNYDVLYDSQSSLFTYVYSFTALSFAANITSFAINASYVDSPLTFGDALPSLGANFGSTVSGTFQPIFSDAQSLTWTFASAGQPELETVAYTSLFGPTAGTGSLQDHTSGPWGDNPGSGGTSIPVPAPVPEASTVMAGALMLLPFGIGAVRSLRKERV